MEKCHLCKCDGNNVIRKRALRIQPGIKISMLQFSNGTLKSSYNIKAPSDLRRTIAATFSLARDLLNYCTAHACVYYYIPVLPVCSGTTGPLNVRMRKL